MLGKGAFPVYLFVLKKKGYFLLLGNGNWVFKILKKALMKEVGDMMVFSQIFSRSVAQNGRALSHWLRADGGSSPPGSAV